MATAVQPKEGSMYIMNNSRYGHMKVLVWNLDAHFAFVSSPTIVTRMRVRLCNTAFYPA